MPLCAFSDNFLMRGVTPVENLFIQEYLPRASGDYVRVYLYGLMQCYLRDESMTLERMAKILDLKPDTVVSAFQYWEREGLVRRVSDQKDAYQYLSLAASMGGESPMDQAIYQHRDFNARLQQLFGNRLLHPAEFMAACEWVEDLRLPEEVVLIMVESQIQRRGRNFQFKQLEKMALKWAEEGVNTVQEARERTLWESDAWQLTQKVLKRLSIHRAPTLPEAETARKWLEEWHLTPDAVMAAVEETVKSRNPSVAYVDGILKRNASVRGGGEMADKLEADNAVNDAVKELHNILGLRHVAPMEGETEKYRQYRAVGFEPETIAMVARELADTKRSPDMQLLDRALASFVERDQVSEEAVRAHLDRQRALREQAERVFKAAGLEKRPSQADAEQVGIWVKDSGLDMALCAAECARGKKWPPAYAQKLLDAWKQAGISSPEEARRSHEALLASHEKGGSADSSRAGAMNYQQREYAPGELDHIYVDWKQYMEDEGDDAK